MLHGFYSKNWQCAGAEGATYAPLSCAAPSKKFGHSFPVLALVAYFLFRLGLARRLNCWAAKQHRDSHS
jgi:hypothetical protein